MEIKQVEPGRLRILLTAQELDAAGLCYETIDCDKSKTRSWLLSLLEAANRATGFLPGKQVAIEIYPEHGGGCLVFLSDTSATRRWRVRRQFDGPVIYRFDDVDTLIAGAVKLFGRASHRIRKSELYTLDDWWMLLVYPLDVVENITLPLLDEYATRCGEGPLAAAWLREHGQVAVGENAVDLLSAYFG